MYALLKSHTKDKHLLTASTLNPSDRQNFASVLRMCSENVTSLLKAHIKNSQATVIYLETIRDILDAYMNPELPPLERIEKIWYRVFILRIWRQFIVSHKKYTLKDNFLTSNCYSCVELNAHSLVLCIFYLKKRELPSWFLPKLYSSQACESTFRQLRSFTPTFSTVTNCSEKEALSRISKIHLQSEIIHKNNSFFNFPRIDQKMNAKIPIFDLPSIKEITNVINKCEQEAVDTMKKLGFKISNNSNFTTCMLPPVDNKKVTKPRQTKKRKTKKRKMKKIIRKFHKLYSKKLKLSDLKNVHLVNYFDKHPDPHEASPFVKIDVNKVVRKEALCWLLRNDYQKLSSDRNRRVMTLTENERVNKNQQTSG